MRSLNAFAALTVLAAVTAAGATPAHAQTAEPKPFRLYLGAMFPSKSETSDRVGTAVFSWGLSYDVPLKKPMAAKPFIYFDGVWASTDDYLNRSISFHY